MENETIRFTTIEELIERLEKDSNEYFETTGTYNGSFEVLRQTYYRYVKNGFTDEEYSFIRGFIWGLYTTQFITDRERDCLIHSLIAERYC